MDRLESFTTNFVADTGSMMLNQAATGQPVTVGDDALDGFAAAGATALFTVSGSTLAASVPNKSVITDILSGKGILGTVFYAAGASIESDIQDIFDGKQQQ